MSYHSRNCSWFLDPESLHHLEDIHHTLCFTALNCSACGTEYSRTSHSVTGKYYTFCLPHVHVHHRYSSNPFCSWHIVHVYAAHMHVLAQKGLRTVNVNACSVQGIVYSVYTCPGIMYCVPAHCLIHPYSHAYQCTHTALTCSG